MNEIKYVKVSPFYNGSGWYDSKSGIFFSKKNENVIKIKDGIDLSNIRYYIRRNYLIDVTAQYDADTKKKEEQKYTVETQATNVSPKTLLKEEAYEVPVVKAEIKEEEIKAEEAVEEAVETYEEAVEAEVEVAQEVQEEEKTETVEKKPTAKKPANKKRK